MPPLPHHSWPPYLRRDMLRWGNESTIEIEIETISSAAIEYEVSGFTESDIFNFNSTPAGDGSVEFFSRPVPNVPIMVAVRCQDSSLELGELYVSVFLKANGERIGLLCCGYLSRTSPLGWPAALPQQEHPHRGHFKEVSVADPAAGSQFTITVPTNELWHLQYVRFDYATDATGGNRYINLKIDPVNSGNFLAVPIRVAFGSSESWGVNFARYGFENTFGYNSYAPGVLPSGLVLQDGGTIESEIPAMGANDTLTNITAYVESFMKS